MNGRFDFARFLEAQALSAELLHAESAADIAVDNEAWDALLASDEGQDLLDKLADEALAAHQAGKSTH
ncbi:MAG: hypothetical protein KC425_24675 [Anaerolineales bacterium]|nr:hypothetical protein [Anaerolineales bacterium]